MKINGREAAFVGFARGVGVVEEGLLGFTPVIVWDLPLSESAKEAEDMNRIAGVDQVVAMELEAGSMFGWHVPAAGRFRRPRGKGGISTK
jgi:hypothetical protein